MNGRAFNSFGVAQDPKGLAKGAIPGVAPIACLLIDDSKFDRQQFRRLAEQTALALDFTEAETLDSALNALRGRSFDVILLDQTLPDGDGTTVAALLAQHLGAETPPMIMVSGSDEAAMPARAIASGCVDFVSKAKMNIPRIEKAIRDAVARRRLAILRAPASAPMSAAGRAVTASAGGISLASAREGFARVMRQVSLAAERQEAAARDLSRLRGSCEQLWAELGEAGRDKPGRAE